MRVKYIKASQSDKDIEKQVNKFLATLGDNQVVSVVIIPPNHNHYVAYATIVYLP